MSSRLVHSVFYVATILLVAACETQPAGPGKGADQLAAGEAGETAKVGKPGEVEQAKSHPDCIGPIAAGTSEAIKIGKAEWELNGSTIKLKTAPANGGGLRIGAISDIKEDSVENLANLESFVTWFKKEKVDFVVVAGDTGLNAAEIENALAVLAKVQVPVFNIVGNREGRTDYRTAMASLAERYDNIFDLNAVRRIDTPVVDLVSLPGYYNQSYIHSDEGCPYFSADIQKMAELVKACDSPALVVSHGGPKQTGTDGIDRTAEGENVGDPELAKLIKDNKIPFGIFGNIHEAGGRATDIDGNQILAQDQPYDALYLNPGPADGIRWVMNDESESVGMAGLLTIKDGKASYQIHRIKPKK